MKYIPGKQQSVFNRDQNITEIETKNWIKRHESGYISSQRVFGCCKLLHRSVWGLWETLKSLCNTTSCGAKSCSFQSSCAVGNLSSVKLTTLALDPNGNCRAIFWKFFLCHLNRFLRFKEEILFMKIIFQTLKCCTMHNFVVLYRKVIIPCIVCFFNSRHKKVWKKNIPTFFTPPP